MTGKQSRDEGAAQTKVIMEAVKRRRNVLGWSAQRLADEMTRTGVPWNADIVVNLEHGRRKSLRVHELMALAWVLDADSPLDLLAPPPPDVIFYPVTPVMYERVEAVRAWWTGETGPPRERLDQSCAWRRGKPPGDLSSQPATCRDGSLRRVDPLRRALA